MTGARKLDRISYEEMLEQASLGAKVLQPRSVELAMVYKVPLQVRSSFEAPDSPNQNKPDGSGPGTIVCEEDKIVEQHVVSGIAYSRDEAKVSIRKVKDQPGVSASVFGPLAEADISVDMIVQNVSTDGSTANITFTVARKDLRKAIEVLNGVKDKIGFLELTHSADVAKVSVVGIGMRSHAGVAAKMFRSLADKGINIQAITTSEIKVSVLIDEAYTELAVRALHQAYGLGGLRAHATQHPSKIHDPLPLETAARGHLLMAHSALGPRVLLRRLREVMAEPETAQKRLDKIATLIAANMVAEVCSIYVMRPGQVLELYATEGLKRAAVHKSKLKVGEGLVGLIGDQAIGLNLADAQNHPSFKYLPETGEEIYHSFLGSPIMRGGTVIGVLVVQNRTRRHYSDEEEEALQTTAMVLAEVIASGELREVAREVAADVAHMRSHHLRGESLADGIALGPCGFA